MKRKITETLALGTFIKLMRASESVAERSFRHLGARGITPSQFAVMEALLHKGALTQTELARKILRTSGNMTMVIDNLEKAGLVCRERSSEDRRAVFVSLTRKGDVLIRKVFPAHAKEVKAQMEVLSAEELDQLGRLCKKLGLQEDTG